MKVYVKTDSGDLFKCSMDDAGLTDNAGSVAEVLTYICDICNLGSLGATPEAGAKCPICNAEVVISSAVAA